MKFDAQGRELPDPTPVAMPMDCKRPESLTEQIRRMIRGEMSQQASDEGKETFEEANDFEVQEEDAELTGTQYELMADELPMQPGPAPRPPRPGEDEDEDDDDEADADGGSDDDDSGLSSGRSHTDPDADEPAASGTPPAGGKGRSGQPLPRDRVGGSGDSGRGRSQNRVEGKPAPHRNPAKGKR